MSVTRDTLRKDIIRKLYTPRITTSATTSGGSTTTLIDNSLKAASQMEDYIATWIYLTEDNGPNIGEVARVIDVDLSSNTLITAPVFSGTVADSTNYELHYKFHPYDINNIIDDIIRVGTRGASPAFSGGTEALKDVDTTTFERDVIVDGALSILKRHLAVDRNLIDAAHLNEEAQFHEDRFRAGILRLGYPPLAEF